MTLPTFTAESEKEKLEIYVSRYKIYVEAIGLKQTYANHEHKTVQEPLDDTANLFFCKRDGRVIGSSRSNYARYGNLGFYPELYEIEDEITLSKDEILIASKLLVEHQHRGASVALSLFGAQYRKALQDGIKTAYLDCMPRKGLVSLYKKLGFTIVKDVVEHPDTGKVCVMKLDMLDIDHLKSVDSPYYKHCLKYLAKSEQLLCN